MTRKQVIKALECCLEHEDCNPWTYCANPCPYGGRNGGNGKCFAEMITDALDLLEEVEPMKKDDMYFCGWCKNALAKTWEFCPKCGTAVKWGRRKDKEEADDGQE